MSSPATPLIALDAVVFDTETTGLDPARARIVEIGAIRLRAGRIRADESFDRLVNPQEAIPPAATAIHGISDAKVAAERAFPDVWRDFQRWQADAIIIGHSLGFDFAVAQRECQRAGIPWKQPRALDIRLLAESCAPHLAGYDLDKLAAWLSVTAKERHSGIGDAVATAGVFVAMLPRLREAGIRTLAEAERACASLSTVLDRHHRAGWLQVAETPTAPEESEDVVRLDLHPYRLRARDLMSASVYAAPQTTIENAIAQMHARGISSLLVAQESGQGALPPREVGIVTEHDVMRVLAQKGAGALALPIGEIASRPLQTVPSDALTYRAIGHMGRLHLRHLGVTDANGGVCGVVSARDLLRLRGLEAIWLGDEIEHAEDVAGLARAWAKLPGIAGRLRAEGLSGVEVALLVSEELRALTRRAAGLALDRLRQAGQGQPPCAYALAVLGSAGRGESLLAMDQDNALVFAEGEPEGEADSWFAAFGAMVSDILHEVGVSYCPGGVMVRNPLWRGSVATWRERVAHWIAQSDPQALLAVDIFFDLRGVHGEASLAFSVWRDGFDQAAGNPAFAKLLAEAAGAAEPGLGVFGRFLAREGRIDLKKTGLFGIVTAARVLAIRHHIAEHATPARLGGLRALGLGHDPDLEALQAAQSVFLDLLVDQQVTDIAQGIPPSNRVALKRLSARERGRLREALRAVAHVDELTRDLLFRD